MLRGVDLAVARDELLLVTGAERLRQDDAAPGLRRARAADAAARSTSTSTGAKLGYLGHEPLVYRELTALENLDLYGRLYRVPERRERIGMLLERFGLWDARGERVASYSRGMTQRLALCRVLLHDPELVILDEPYTALDADGRRAARPRARRARDGRALLVSTHDPARVEPLATASLALA